MTKKGQEVEGGLFVLHFSANLCYIQRNVPDTICSQQFNVSNRKIKISNASLILMQGRFN
jgi:hypothetical protein